jgi:hypothetical protein
VLGRRVKPLWSPVGVVVRWEPLSAAMTDALVLADDGSESWHASYTLVPVDGLGLLPTRRAARERADAARLAQLRSIRMGLVCGLREPWPGCEFGKVHLGRALDAAIADIGGAR